LLSRNGRAGAEWNREIVEKTEARRPRRPKLLERGVAQDALATVGERESGIARFEEAVAQSFCWAMVGARIRRDNTSFSAIPASTRLGLARALLRITHHSVSQPCDLAQRGGGAKQNEGSHAVALAAGRPSCCPVCAWEVPGRAVSAYGSTSDIGRKSLEDRF
jgi:hypothetical protein